MVQGFEHVGMTSSNLDRTIAFYGGLLGLKEILVKRTDEGGRIAFLETGGVMLEIVEPAAPIQTPAREVPVTEAGIRHITFRVDDVEAVYDKLRAAGVEFTVPPRRAANAELIRKVAFCRDPDGIVVEFLERV
ncbi:VOC family protein [Microvirga sp. CF3016]|uniref:VOC family protein n=1 Tax=Microvirga sp. CF3016 TaxID=3110181 RepID=UPI002E79EB1B|nr:VOC family protein [Microvirga sp. CF3016]MEE1610854.1 VOC family protein [Microvirga sp. CF3016]